MSFAGDNSFANQGAEPNNFQTFMVSNSQRGAGDVDTPLDRAQAVSIAAKSNYNQRNTADKPGS